MTKYGTKKNLYDTKNKNKLSFQPCIHSYDNVNNSWIDIELEIDYKDNPYTVFSIRIMEKHYQEILNLFSEQHENYLKKVAPLPSSPELFIYAGIDKMENKYLIFEDINYWYNKSKIYFYLKDIFFLFMENPSEENFQKLELLSDDDFSKKDFFMTNTGKADKVFQKIILELKNYERYQDFNLIDKKHFFTEVFERELKKTYNLDYYDLNDIDKHNISCLFNKYFESTL